MTPDGIGTAARITFLIAVALCAGIIIGVSLEAVKAGLLIFSAAIAHR